MSTQEFLANRSSFTLRAGFAGVLDVDGLRELLEIPSEVTPVGVIPVGHPSKDKPSTSLKQGQEPLGEVIH